jgi:archaemetzincin
MKPSGSRWLYADASAAVIARTYSAKDMQSLIYAVMLSFLVTGPAMAFEAPGPESRRQAIGPTNSLSAAMQRALQPDEDFKPIPVPGPDDWLTAHPERGQTFNDFQLFPGNKPDKIRHTIYFQALGDFPAQVSPSLEKLREFASAYFQMNVKLLPPIPSAEQPFKTRINSRTRNRQVLTADILRFLPQKLPGDAYCLLAITMDDLYPDPTWNFVFGQASLQERVGVYSFARYDPVFYHLPRGKDYEQILLRRSCKALVHETAHMFGLTHCIYFSCVMNDSNHLEESDRRPFHLCPVCLRKLHHSVEFDVVKRERELLEFYKQNQFKGEAQWMSRRLEKIRARAEQ